MNKRIKKYRSDANINTISASPTVPKKHKSFILPQIKDNNLLSTSKQSFTNESKKDPKSKKSKSEANSPLSLESISPSSTFDQISQKAKSTALSISSDKPIKSKTPLYSQSTFESLDTIFPIPKEAYKFKVIAAAIEENPDKYKLKFHKENSNIKCDDFSKIIKNFINDGENETLTSKLENNIIKYKKLEDTYITDTDILKKEIEKYKQKYKQVKVDYKILTQRYETLNQKHNLKIDQMEKSEEFYIEEILKLQNDIKHMENGQCLKGNEIIRLSDYYKKMSKDNENRINDFNEKIVSMERCIKNQTNEIIALKDLVTTTKALYQREKTSSESLKISLEEIQELKDQNLKLQVKLNNIQSNLEFSLEEKKKYHNYMLRKKKKFLETEKKIRNLTKNFPTEKINSQVKITKTAALRNISFTGIGENIEDVYESMLKSIDMLKEEIRACKEDNEKLNKDLAYAKKNAEEKNALINLMEKRFGEDVEDKVKTEVLRNVSKLMKKYDKKIDGVFFQIGCALNDKSTKYADDDDFSIVKVSGDCLQALKNGHSFFTEFIKEFKSEFCVD